MIPEAWKRRRPGACRLPARALAALALIGMLAAGAAGARQAAEGDPYVCPPCGCSEDGKEIGAAGDCPACRMKLIRRSQLQRVAILLFDGVQIIDYTAPWEVFGQAGFEVYTVARGGKPITTAMGMSVNPTRGFQDGPEPTILLVPGGRGVRAALSDTETMAWVKKTAGGARHVLSVCNGAFILARAGLLDGQKATTTYYLLDDLEGAAPGIQVVRDRRYVDNGKVITSAGLSAGLDAALHLVSKIRGLAAAQRLALGIEYDWKPGGGLARATLADQHMPRLTGPGWEQVEQLSTSGDSDRWEATYRVRDEATPSELLLRVKTVLENLGKWTAAGVVGPGGPAEAGWSFLDDRGVSWSGTARVEPEAGQPGWRSIRIVVSRDAATRRSG